MAIKPCTGCKVGDKAKGKHRCIECLLAAMPAHQREEAADRRAEAIPPELHLARVPPEDWPEGRRWCAGCQTFVRLRDCRKDGTRCKTCAGRVQHAGMLRRTYTIHGRPFTADDYAALFKFQEGRCRVCRKRPRVKRLAVDHDHLTGEVRGLLCADNEWGCNYLLGKVDDVEILQRLLDYKINPPAPRVIAA